MNFQEKVLKVQSELKAPKNQRNNFGKYNYRSCEDILEAVKQLLKQAGLTLMITDEIKEVGGLTFVEARTVLFNDEGRIETTAQAGIDPNRKGMDIAQSFGSSSSYARKYALGALFLLSGEACPDYASELNEKNKELVDSLNTLQDKDKDKGKDKDKVKDITIPKLGKVRKDVKRNDGENTIVPVDGKVITLKDLDDVKIDFLYLRKSNFFPNHPVFCKALEEVKTARELAEEVEM